MIVDIFYLAVIDTEAPVLMSRRQRRWRQSRRREGEERFYTSRRRLEGHMCSSTAGWQNVVEE